MKKYLCIIIAISILTAICGCSSKTKVNEASSVSEQTNYPSNREISYEFIDFKDFDNYLTDGKYKCGSDFPEGDYYIMSIHGAAALYDVCDNPNDFSWYDYRLMRKISVKVGQYIYLSNGAICVPADEVNIDNWNQYGVFLVGVDLPEGDYKITSITDEYCTELDNISGIRGAYQICEKSPENEPIECQPLFDKQTYISVKDGQYIIINNAYMTLD